MYKLTPIIIPNIIIKRNLAVFEKRLRGSQTSSRAGSIFDCIVNRAYARNGEHTWMKCHDYLGRLFSICASISLIRPLICYKRKVFTIRRLSKVGDVSSSQSAVTIAELERFAMMVTTQPAGRSLSVLLNEKSKHSD